MLKDLIAIFHLGIIIFYLQNIVLAYFHYIKYLQLYYNNIEICFQKENLNIILIINIFNITYNIL